MRELSLDFENYKIIDDSVHIKQFVKKSQELISVMVKTEVQETGLKTKNNYKIH